MIVFFAVQKLFSLRDFTGGPVVKNPPSKAGDAGLIPGWGTKISQAVPQGKKKKKKYVLSTREKVVKEITKRDIVPALRQPIA